MNRLSRSILALLVLGTLVTVTLSLRETESTQTVSSGMDDFVFHAPSDGEIFPYPPAHLRLPDHVKPVAFDFPPPPVASYRDVEQAGPVTQQQIERLPDVPPVDPTASEPAVTVGTPISSQNLGLEPSRFGSSLDWENEIDALPDWDAREAPLDKPPWSVTEQESDPLTTRDEFTVGDTERLPEVLDDDVQVESFGPALELNNAPVPHVDAPDETGNLNLSIPQPTRNPDLTVAERLANQRIDYGISLATRNAYYSARKEFETALRLICTALDAQEPRPSHVRKMAAGLRALREADDFAGSETRAWEDAIDLTSIINGHRTPVLHDSTASPLSPWVARQRYYTYAQQQLAEACGHEPVASRALYNMGKWYSFVETNNTGLLVSGPNAVVFFQAALSVDPQNHLAANELGVLLARFGQLPDARRILLHAVSVGGEAEAWHNLSIVHKRLGEIDLSQRAAYEGQVATRRPSAAGAGRSDKPVSWVDTQTFIQMSPKEVAPPRQMQPGSIGPAANSAAVPSRIN